MHASSGRTSHFLPAAVLVVALASLWLLVAGPDADAAKRIVCTKGKTGKTKLITAGKTGKACPRLWRRVARKSRAKRKRARGAVQVRDAKGRFVGRSLGVFPAPYPIYMVEHNRGVFTYVGTGKLVGLASLPPVYRTMDCSGPAWVQSPAPAAKRRMVRKLLGGSYRVVFRPMTGSLTPKGKAKAWKSSGKFKAATAIQLYRQNGSTGACEPSGGPFTGDLLRLKRVGTPRDFTGPLRLR